MLDPYMKIPQLNNLIRHDYLPHFVEEIKLDHKRKAIYPRSLSMIARIKPKLTGFKTVFFSLSNHPFLA